MATEKSQKQTVPNGYINNTTENGEYELQDDYQTSPAYLTPNPKALHVRVHVNNDVFEPGRKMTVQVNKIKTFENFLEECTEKFKPAFGAARRLYTARGRHRIQKLEELAEDSIYVITGNEPFKRHNYREIPDRVRLHRHQKYKKIDLTRIYIPVQHALEERLRKKSGRSYYLNEHRRGLRLRVHVNGMNERPSCPVSIRYKDKDNFAKILEEIEVTMNLQPIEKIYKVVNQGGCPENFTEITGADQLEADEHILVLPKNEKKLQVKFYSSEGKTNFKVTTSPRAGQYYLYPSFPLDRNNTRHNKSLNKHKPLPSIGSSANDTMSPFSNPPGSNGGGSKANKNKAVKQVDYDKDDGGVYRAKKQNNAQGAPQVYESKETIVDRPIDQMKAEIVKEEDIDTEEVMSPVPAVKQNNKNLSVEPIKNSKSKSQTRPTEEDTDTEEVMSPVPSVKQSSKNLSVQPIKNSKSKSQTKPTEEKIDQDSGMHRIDEYEDESFNQYDHNASGTQSKDPWGSTPVSRGEARRKKELIEQQAAAKIQAGARGYKARKEYKAKKAELSQREADQKVADEIHEQNVQEQADRKKMDQDLAASKIQASFKGYQTRKEVTERRQQVCESKDDEKYKAALKIQSGYKGYKVRKAYNERKMQLHNELEMSNKDLDDNVNAQLADDDDRQAVKQEAAIKIQSSYRGYKTRKNWRDKKLLNKDNTLGTPNVKTMKRDEAAVIIQSSYKGYKTRKTFANREKEKHSDEQKEKVNESASKIQASFKGYKVRKELTERKQKNEIEESTKKEAAAKIHAFYRGYITRKKLVKPNEPQLPDQAPSHTTDDNAEIDKAATQIQSSYRGFRTRKEYKTKVTDDAVGDADLDQLPLSSVTSVSITKSQLISGCKQDAASEIQSAFRVFRLKKYLADKHSVTDVLTDSNNKISAAFRGYLTRKTHYLLKRKNDAATKIQAYYRGYMIRKIKLCMYSKKAVNFLHAAIRGYITRKLNQNRTKISEKLMYVQNGGHFATVVQALCKGFLTRHLIKFEDRIKSATSLQGPSKSNLEDANGFNSEVSYWKNSNVKMYSDKTLRLAASKIQSAYYMYVTRGMYRKNKSHKFDLRNEYTDEDVNAAITIQACYRGHLVRKTRAKELCLQTMKSEEIVERDESIESMIELNNGKPARVSSSKSRVMFSDDLEIFDENEEGNVLNEKMKNRDNENETSIEEEAVIHNEQEDLKLDEKNSEKNEHEEIRHSESLVMKNSVMKETEQLDKAPQEEAFSKEFHDANKTNIVHLDDENSFHSPVDNVGTLRSSSSLSCPASSLKSVTILSLSDTERDHRKGSAKSMCTWKSSEKIKFSGGEIEREGESLREIEDDAGELSSIEKNVNAVIQLQSAFRSYRLRREISELISGGGELMDIQTINRAVSALRKDFRLRSAKIRRLGSSQSDEFGNNWWHDEHSDLTDQRLSGIVGEDDSYVNKEGAVDDEVSAAVHGEKERELANSKFNENVTDIRANDNKIKAAMNGYLTRKHAKVLKGRNANNTIEAAFRGYRTRKTELGIKCDQITSSRERSFGGSHRSSSSPSYQRSAGKMIYHVQMHSDIIEESATKLQASFAGYLSRKVFISLAKFVEENENSNADTSGHHLERMGSLSETDDSKLRLKTIGMRLRKGKLADENYLVSLNRHSVLPPISPQTVGRLTENLLRPKSGIPVGQNGLMSISLGKAKTQPDLYSSYCRSKETETPDGIKTDIKVIVAATVIQSYAKGHLTRMTFEDLNISKASSAGLNVSSLSDSSNISKQDERVVETRSRTPLSKVSRMSFKSVKDSSSKDPKAHSKEAKNQKDSSNWAKEEMNELVRVRTASVKLEAERRKLIAEKIRLKTQAAATSQEAILKQDQNLQHNKDANIEQQKSTPKRLSPIVSSRDEIDDKLKQQHDAAVKIQKVYRGFRARNEIKLKKETQTLLENEYEVWKRKRIMAAVSIQSVWRGFLVRKELSDTADRTSNFSASEPKGMIIINIGRSKSDIERANKKYDNASMIQMVFRACKIRRKLNIKFAVRRHDRNKAASKIQAFYQAFLTRKAHKQFDSGIKIRSVFKAFMVRKKVQKRKVVEMQEKLMAASHLQAAYLSFMKRRENEALRLDRSMNRAAVDIQSAIRGHVIRWELCRRKEKLQLQAADKIQAAMRGHHMREKMKKLRAAATVIVACFKSFKDRQTVLSYKNKLKQERVAATRLQAAYKGHLMRNSTQEYKEKLARENKAAEKIHVSVHGMTARLKYRREKKIKAYNEKLDRAATQIQMSVHGMNVRMKYLKAKKALERVRETAALKIQSVYRGHKARKIAKLEKHVKDVHESAEEIVELLIKQSLDYVQRRSDSTERIQAAGKGYRTRKQMADKQSDENKLKAKVKQISATIIQTVARANMSRDRQKYLHMMYEMNSAAVKIQSFWRGYNIRKDLARERKIIANIKAPRQPSLSARTHSGRLISLSLDTVLMKNARAIIQFHKKATELQAAVRACRTRNELKDRMVRKTDVSKHTPRVSSSVSRNLSKEDKAAILIQRTFKGYSERKAYHFMVSQKRKLWDQAASNIQASVKGYQVRGAYVRNRLRLRLEGKREMLRKKCEAANVICCSYRSYKYRRAKVALRAEM